MAMSDEDRHKLAEKLDQDIDDFVAEKLSKPREPMPEDNRSIDEIAEELKKHPAFLTEFDPSKPLSPMMEGLQALKYESESPEFNADSYKDDGNHNFKIKKYRWAVASYTTGITQMCKSRELNAILYSNRAAAHYYLQNFRSSLRDATIALKFKPDHMKAFVRGAMCCMEMKKYKECIQWSQDGLMFDKDNKTFLQLRPKADKLMRQQEKEKRKELARERKEQTEEQTLLKVITSRGVKLAGSKINKSSKSHPMLSASLYSENPAGAKVCIDDQGILHWPVLFLYPECGETDIIASFNENSCLEEHIEKMFGVSSQPAPWDVEKKYKPADIEVYFEDTEKDKLIRLKKSSKLGDILKHERYFVYGGTPGFVLLVKNSGFAKEFISRYEKN